MSSQNTQVEEILEDTRRVLAHTVATQPAPAASGCCSATQPASAAASCCSAPQPAPAVAACCSASQQESCCAPSEKSSCCGAESAAGGSCGCQ
jgi:hypothetical protein